MNSTPACSLFRGDLSGAGQIFHVALLQQVQVLVHNQRGHFHAAPAVLKMSLGLDAESAMRIFIGQSPHRARVQLAELLLLGRNLDQQALAQTRWRPRLPGQDAAPGRWRWHNQIALRRPVPPSACSSRRIVLCSREQMPRPVLPRWWPDIRLRPGFQSRTRAASQSWGSRVSAPSCHAR